MAFIADSSWNGGDWQLNALRVSYSQLVFIEIWSEFSGKCWDLKMLPATFWNICSWCHLAQVWNLPPIQMVGQLSIKRKTSNLHQSTALKMLNFVGVVRSKRHLATALREIYRWTVRPHTITVCETKRLWIEQVKGYLTMCLFIKFDK